MRKNLIICVCLLALNCLHLHSQNINFSKRIGDLIYTFKSSEISTKKYSSEFKVLNSNNSTHYLTTYTEDENPADFKIINADKISQIECRTSLSAQQLTQIIVDTDKFIDDLISELRLSGDNIFLAQLWFHYAIVNKQKRKILSGECNCTVDPSYLVGKTNFLCMEDHYINRTTTINTINQNPLAFTDNKGDSY